MDKSAFLTGVFCAVFIVIAVLVGKSKTDGAHTVRLIVMNSMAYGRTQLHLHQHLGWIHSEEIDKMVLQYVTLRNLGDPVDEIGAYIHVVDNNPVPYTTTRAFNYPHFAELLKEPARGCTE